MSLIVESGTGLSNAESFVSVADATAYHAARGNAAWAALSDTVHEQYLRRATDYLEGVYRERWAGYRVTITQALSWPRAEVPMRDAAAGGYYAAYYPFDEVPVLVANACAILALKAASGALAPDIGRTTKREKVGELEVEYADGAKPFVQYREIDLMLAPLLSSSGNSLKVVRS